MGRMVGTQEEHARSGPLTRLLLSGRLAARTRSTLPALPDVAARSLLFREGQGWRTLPLQGAVRQRARRGGWVIPVHLQIPGAEQFGQLHMIVPGLPKSWSLFA